MTMQTYRYSIPIIVMLLLLERGGRFRNLCTNFTFIEEMIANMVDGLWLSYSSHFA